MRLANSPAALKASLAVTRATCRYSSTVAGVAADVLWFTPWRVPVSDRGLAKQARWLEPTEPYALKTPVGRVAGFTAGKGPAILLVHGWGERAAALGGFISPLTRAGYRVVGIDLPAHGDSSGGRTNIIQAAEAILAVANHFGGSHAVIAHSMGANTTLWSLKHGLKAQKVVLIAPNIDIAYTMQSFQFLFGLPDEAMDALSRRIERRFGNTVWKDIRGDLLARGLELPGLVFHDPDDPQMPFEGSLRLVEAWPRAELVRAAGLGHGAITRDPGVIERAVAFLEGRNVSISSALEHQQRRIAAQ